MDLFKLVGRIVIKNEEANQAIDNTTTKAGNLGTALSGAGTSADNAAAGPNELDMAITAITAFAPLTCPALTKYIPKMVIATPANKMTPSVTTRWVHSSFLSLPLLKYHRKI